MPAYERQTDPGTAWAVIAIGVMILAMVLPMIGSEVCPFYRQSRVSSMPTVVGTVLESRIAYSTRAAFSGSSTVHTEPLIRYRYDVDGVTYESSRFGFQDFELREEACAAIVAQYAQGTEVTVFYDVDDPGQAVIANRSAKLNYTIVALCAALFWLGAGAVISGLWARPWQGPADA